MARLSAKAKSRIYANLEKYARSGMGMEKACDSLLRQPRLSSTERRIYQGILSGLKNGKSIGDSLGGSSRVISPLEHEVVAASEAGGKLEKGFGHLAEYFKRIDRTRRKIVKGLTYPVVLIHFAVPVSTLAVAAFRSFSLDGETRAGGYQHAFMSSGKAMLAAYLLVILGFVAAALLNRAGRTSGWGRFPPFAGFPCWEKRKGPSRWSAFPGLRDFPARGKKDERCPRRCRACLG